MCLRGSRFFIVRLTTRDEMPLIYVHHLGDGEVDSVGGSGGESGESAVYRPEVEANWMIAVGATGILGVRSLRMQVDESNARSRAADASPYLGDSACGGQGGPDRRPGLRGVALSYAQIMKRSWRTRLVLSLLLMSAGVACGRDDERRSVKLDPRDHRVGYDGRGP